VYNGIPIIMIETKEQPIGIDTQEDLVAARKRIAKENK
jgi:CMP-2-keto-3-deoxyoctulosonic acid synthetase